MDLIQNSQVSQLIFQNCSSWLPGRTSGAGTLEEYVDRNRIVVNASWSENKTLVDGFSIAFSDPVVLMKTVGLGLMILLTVLGNMLVIASVMPSPTLRTPTHSLIVNLAVADLLLGSAVLPLSAARELADGRWLLGSALCSIWTTLDVLCCTASILSLCGISVDRYIGVSRPLAYSRIITKRRVHCLIAGIWALALAISIAPPLGWKEDVVEHDLGKSEEMDECQVNKDLGYVIFSACGSFYLPTLVILVLYTLVYRAAVRHSNFMESGMRTTRSHVTLRVHLGSSQRGASFRESLYEGHMCQKTKPFAGSPTYLYPCHSSRSLDKENNGWSSCASENSRRLTVAGFYGRAAKFRRQKKAAKTLGIVVGCFLLCWFPFFLILPLDAACSSCHLSGALFNFAFWLGYFNSCLNPFIYACSSRELRRAFRHILCCRRKSADSRQRSFNSGSAISIRRIN